MTNKNYKCDDCNSSFSRKWNALRHNETKHANSARIYNDNIRTNRVSYKIHNNCNCYYYSYSETTITSHYVPIFPLKTQRF